MENKCSIIHNIFKFIVFQRCQKVLLWSKGLKATIVVAEKTVVLYLSKFIFIFTRFNLPEDFNLDSIVEKCPFTLTGADFYALSSDAMLNAVKRRIQELELGMNFFENIFFGGGGAIFTFSV